MLKLLGEFIECIFHTHLNWLLGSDKAETAVTAPNECPIIILFEKSNESFNPSKTDIEEGESLIMWSGSLFFKVPEFSFFKASNVVKISSILIPNCRKTKDDVWLIHFRQK